MFSFIRIFLWRIVWTSCNNKVLSAHRWCNMQCGQRRPARGWSMRPRRRPRSPSSGPRTPAEPDPSAARDTPTTVVPARLRRAAPASRRSRGRCPCRGSASRTGGPTCPAPAARCSPSLLEHTVSQDNVNSDTVCLAVADYHISMALDFALKAPAARCAPRLSYAGGRGR